jgi:membrane protease YdiL (CAAX protease family)
MMLNPLQGSLGEELGWRGYALPRLLSGRSPLAASVMLGVLVAGWHAPLFVTGVYANAWLHILFVITTTVLYTLLYGGTRGSVLLAMVFHTGWNLVPATFRDDQASTDEAPRQIRVGGLAAGVQIGRPLHLLAGDHHERQVLTQRRGAHRFSHDRFVGRRLVIQRAARRGPETERLYLLVHLW